jgi:hypothetical protein
MFASQPTQEKTSMLVEKKESDFENVTHSSTKRLHPVHPAHLFDKKAASCTFFETNGQFFEIVCSEKRAYFTQI